MDKASAERLAKVHPVLGKKVAQLIANCADRGIEVRVVQGLRTFAEQDKLYNQPWDKKDNDGDGKVDERDEKVTNARGGFSNHNYGLATDVCPFKNNKPDWNDLAAFKIISVEAKKLGLESGADWKFVDRPHVQLKGLSVKECQYFYKKGGIQAVWNRMSELLRGAPANTFTPSAEDLLEFGDIGGAVRQLQQQLISLGFMFPHELDGNFGKITKNAVIGFQRQHRLTADGIVRPGTKAKLAELTANKQVFQGLQQSEIKLEIPPIPAASQSTNLPNIPVATNATDSVKPVEKSPLTENPAELPPPSQVAEAIVNVSAENDAPKIEAAQNSDDVEISETKKAGFWGKAGGIVGGVFTGAYTIPQLNLSAEVLSLIKLLLPYAVVGLLIALCVWYITKKVNNFQLTKLKATINADPTLRNIRFVPHEKPQGKFNSILSAFSFGLVLSLFFIFFI